MLRSGWRLAASGLVAAAFGATSASGPTGALPASVGGHGVASYDVVVTVPGAAPVSLHAEERGRGRPVVLLHGLGGSTYSWRAVAPLLARSHRVIAIDLKGFGRSSKVFDTAYSAADQAQLVTAFLAARRLTDVTLVGHSFGGQVALLTALDLRRRGGAAIRQLALIDVPALPQRLSPVVALMQQPVLPYLLLTALPPPIATRIALTTPSLHRYERPYTEADIDAYSRPYFDAAARHAYVQTARQIVPANLPAIVRRYREVAQPTLLVWCRADDIVPLANGQRLARILPNARLETIDGCNHAPPDEAPHALGRALLRFIDP